jgi:hypothetical protein
MPKRSKRKAVEQHTFLSIRVEQHDAGAETGLNLELVASRPFNDSPDDFIYECSTRLVIRSMSCYPVYPNGIEGMVSEGEATGSACVRGAIARPNLTAQEKWY